ncbi:MAG TPA: signal peptidase II [Bacteroidota bacterium]|nr:signal peptidase II [Bacteroidota bacterium]
MKVLWVTLCVVIADQVSKLAVKGISIPWAGISLKGVPIGSSYQLAGDWVRLTFIENPGMAFGIDLGGKLYLTLFSIAASIGIFAYLWFVRNEKLLFRLSLALVLGGAIGNLVDRIFYGVIYGDGGLFYGKVVDFIDVDFFNVTLFGYHLQRFWVFNIADAAVTIGVIIMLLFHRSFVKNEAVQVSSSSAETPSGPASL